MNRETAGHVSNTKIMYVSEAFPWEVEMSDNQVRWAVIGAGGIARRRTIPEGILASQNARLVAVQSNTNVVAVATQFNLPGFSTVGELLQCDFDAVYIATPVHLHLPNVEQAAHAGKHVLCEKPLGINVMEAERIVAVCQESGVRLGTGLMMRFQSQHVEAAQIVRRGEIGTPVFARAQLSCWYPPILGAWRQNPSQGGGGALMDLGCHCIDLLEFIVGKIHRVTCSASTRVHAYPVEDTAVVLVEFENGARGVVDVHFNIPDAASQNRLEVYGSGGSILASGTIGQGQAGEMRLISNHSQSKYDAQQIRDASGRGEARVIAPPPINLYRAQIEAFSQAILHRRQPPVDGEHGLRIQRLLAACYASAARAGNPEQL